MWLVGFPAISSDSSSLVSPTKPHYGIPMHCFAFHLMPWDRLPADFDTKYESAWTWLPNSLYDPQHGHSSTTAISTSWCLADELGFDGVCVNEHHQNAYGTMPSPNLMGAILARQTKRVKIAVIGNALPLYNPVTRVAEEFAMIDVISGGRLIAGLVVGGGPEYYSFSMNPTNARAMFQEGMDLVLRAWTEPGPFEHYGEFWKLKYVNPWPRPIQQPHPTDLDSRRGQQGDDRAGRRPPLRLHGHSVFPHRLLPAQLRHVPRGAPRRAATKPAPTSSAGSARSTSPRPTSRPGPSTKSTCSTSPSNCSRASSSCRPATPASARSPASTRPCRNS